MIEFIKKNIFIILIFFVTLFVGFITFLTFIDKSFIQLNDNNLQYLLLANIIAVGFLMLSSSNIQYEYLWIGLAIVMMYIIFQIRDKSSKSSTKSYTSKI